MKIGIFSFPNMTGYGCFLPIYALYRAVDQAGAAPKIINYRNEYGKARRQDRVCKAVLHGISEIYRGAVR